MPPTALITGASRGIGRAIALALGRLHWNILVNYRANAPAAREVVTTIHSVGGRARAIRADISRPADRKRLLQKSLAAFGRIDFLVNNAGVAPESRDDLLQASEKSFDRLLNINLKAPFFLTQLVANQMIRQQSSRPIHPSRLKPQDSSLTTPAIITISSISAYTASTHRADYCISKAGLSMMTTLYAARLAEFGINVYEIRPGIIQTDMTASPRIQAKYNHLIKHGLTPIPRWGQPDDVAKAVLAIATGLLPFSTGEILNIDGGFHLRRL